jgi:hypothetical protein
MLIDLFFCASQLHNLRHALQWKSRALKNSGIAGVFRQLYNAYLTSSNANVLPYGRSVIVALLATRVVNSELHTGARPSVRLCVGLKNWTRLDQT